MAINLTTPVAKALSLIFSLGPDIVKAATYVRPPGASASGSVASAEVVASCSVVIDEVQTRSLSAHPIAVMLVRVSELTTIDVPAKGDYFTFADFTRREVVEDPIKDPTGQFYQFKTTRTSTNEDWGDLQAHLSSADWGDLTAHTTAEDWGPLF
jgi:hypothetical protein